MTFNLIPYLQRIAACRGGELCYGLLLDRWIVWCVDAEQARLIEGLWVAWIGNSKYNAPRPP